MDMNNVIKFRDNRLIIGIEINGDGIIGRVLRNGEELHKIEIKGGDFDQVMIMAKDYLEAICRKLR